MTSRGAEGTVTVSLYPPFSDRAGRRQVTVAGHFLPVTELLRLICEECPGLAPSLLQDGKHAEAALLLANGRIIGPDDEVAAGDELSLLAAAWGG